MNVLSRLLLWYYQYEFMDVLTDVVIWVHLQFLT